MTVDHLIDVAIPGDIVLLEGSARKPVLLRELLVPRMVIFFYPATGVPGRDPEIDPAPGWDAIPGAAGCTLQNRGFRDRIEAFTRNGVHVIGISTQPAEEQEEFSARERIPFRLLSDAGLALTCALQLPTFQVLARTFVQRMAIFVADGVIRHVFYPVDVPADSAASVLAWLARNTSPPENSGGSSSTHAR